jgi:cytochrome b6-f complex iron-sulfur subunit
MDRKEFLKRLGYSAAAFFIADYLSGCSKDNQIPFVDFTLDLTDPQYNVLLNLGGYVYVQNVIVARAVDGSYLALSQICTHQGCTVQYAVAQNNIVCPCHGSEYDIHGNVIQGPSTSPLFEYATQLTGTLLHVYTP